MEKVIENRIKGVWVYVPDLKKASEWYCNHLGFGVGDYDYNDFVELYMDGEMVLHLLKTDHFVPASDATFSFASPDIHEAYRSLKKKGVEIVSGITDFSDHSMFKFKDLDGNTLTIVRFSGDYEADGEEHEL